jgi:excisionase family DNA binding protein
MTQEFFSPEEIADLLGIAAYTVRELCRRGLMRHARVGRRIRIKRQWAEEYMMTTAREPRR